MGMKHAWHSYMEEKLAFDLYSQIAIDSHFEMLLGYKYL